MTASLTICYQNVSIPAASKSYKGHPLILLIQKWGHRECFLLKKNSCINKSYLWKQWTIFSTELYLSSLSWKSLSLTDTAESSFWWTIMYSHGSGLPTFSMCQHHTESCQISWGRSPTNITRKQNSSCERYAGSNFSRENQWNKKGATYLYWQKLGSSTLQVKAGSKRKVAFAFLPNDTQGDF